MRVAATLATSALTMSSVMSALLPAKLRAASALIVSTSRACWAFWSFSGLPSASINSKLPNTVAILGSNGSLSAIFDAFL